MHRAALSSPDHPKWTMQPDAGSGTLAPCSGGDPNAHG
jgi:hypothetical protein